MSAALGGAGQTRPGRIGEQPPPTSAVATPRGSPEEEVRAAIQSTNVVVFSKLVCPKCVKAKQVLVNYLGEGGFTVIQLDSRPDGPQMQDVLETMTGQRTMPRIFIGGECIGGSDDLDRLAAEGVLSRMLGRA